MTADVRIAMLLASPARRDSRVHREGEALTAAGYMVRVFCEAAAGLSAVESRGGVTYVRVSLAAPRGPGFLRWLGRGPRASRGLWLLRAMVFGPLGLIVALVRRPDTAPATGQARPEPKPRRGALGALARIAGVLYRNSFVFPELQDAAAAWRPTVVHAHDLRMLPAAAAVAERVGASLVYDAHEFEASRNPPRPALQQWWYDLHERALARTATAVITVSGGIARRMQQDLHLPARPAIVMNAPACTGSDARCGSTLRERLDVPRDAVLAVYLGAAGPGRGVDLTIDALAGAPGLHLAVVGDQEAAIARRLHKRALAREVAGRVHFVPAVPAEAIGSFIRDADFGVVPLEPTCLSHRLALPNKLFEAVFAGLPVLVSDLEEMRALVIGHRLGAVVDVRDPTRFRAALRDFTTNPPGPLDETTRQVLAWRYGWTAQSSRLRSVYREVLNAQGTEATGVAAARNRRSTSASTESRQDASGMSCGASGRVVMLAGNDAVADGRVIKEAEALAAAGYETIVLCLQSDRCRANTVHNDVTYRRLPPTRSWFRARGWFAEPTTRAALARVPLAVEAPSDASARLAIGPEPTCRAGRRPLVERAGREAFRLAGKAALRITNYGRRAVLQVHLRRIEARRHSGAAYRAAVLDELLALAPNVVHAHDLVTLATAVAAKRRLGCRIIYDAHELETERNANHFPWTWRVIRRTERKLVRHCDAVITVSGRIAEHLAELYAIVRPTVIYNSPAIGPFDVDAEARPNVREHLGVEKGVSLAVYVGSITVGRGLAVAVSAIARLPQSFHLALIGPRRPATYEELEELCRSLCVRDRVHFVPPVPPADVVPFIRGADLSLSLVEDVCLSYRYCMPNKLFESVFAGVPVLASDLPEIADFLLRTGTGRVVDLADVEAVATAIRAICTTERIVIGAEQRRHLEATWGWSAQTARLRELYVGLIPEACHQENRHDQ